MTPSQYQSFIDLLTHNLAQDPRVLGLVALGSMAQQDVQPDQFSDHDFFVIVARETQTHFRNELAWLPAHNTIVLAFTETEHGLKVIYDDGHLLEFAVFDREELRLARTNRYRVLVDKADVSTVMAAITKITTESSARETADSHYHVGQFITNLLVGYGRYRRGERLSGQKFIKSNALHHLLILLAQHKPSSKNHLLDNLDATHRFEQAYPALGAEIETLLLQDTAVAARGLLALARRELAAIWPQDMQQAAAIIAQKLHER